MSDIFAPERSYDRRKDDLKGSPYNRFIRKLIVVLSATGGLTWFGGPFFVWWLSTQYVEKKEALDDIEVVKTDIALVKAEIGTLKASDKLTNAHLMRIEDKVDIILLSVKGLGQKLGSKPRRTEE